MSVALLEAGEPHLNDPNILLSAQFGKTFNDPKVLDTVNRYILMTDFESVNSMIGKIIRSTSGGLSVYAPVSCRAFPTVPQKKNLNLAPDWNRGKGLGMHFVRKYHLAHCLKGQVGHLQ